MDHNTIIEISAFSGLAGALLTQLLTGLFGFFADKRKYHIELKNALRSKKVEIGENLYYINTETMTILKKNIAFWKNWNDSRSERSIDYLRSERNALNDRLAKINADNWKFNLVTLYFNVKLSTQEISEINSRSQGLFLRILDLTDLIRMENGKDNEQLYQEYNLKVFDLCGQYEKIYQLLEQDINLVKNELIQEYTRL